MGSTETLEGPRERGRRALRSLVRDVPDFPTPGVLFKDIGPVLADAAGLAAVVDALADRARRSEATKVVGIEARGFLLATPVAVAVGVGMVPVRKTGKLPGDVVAETYSLEYGTATIEIQQGAVGPGDRVLLVDDVLATGGTALAAAGLLTRLGAEVVEAAVLLEIAVLGGRPRLAPLPVSALDTV